MADSATDAVIDCTRSRHRPRVPCRPLERAARVPDVKRLGAVDLFHAVHQGQVQVLRDEVGPDALDLVRAGGQGLAGERLRDLEKTLASLREFEFRLFVLYLEARDEVLVRRFSETRRPHPLSADKPLREAIRLERRRLRTIRDRSDIIIDTSTYSIHQVKALVIERFKTHPREERLIVHLVSFGYKHGVPLESDLTTPLAYFLNNPEMNLDSATQGLLNPGDLLKRLPGQRPLRGLYMVQPYEPGKIPVLMIHGVWSSPIRCRIVACRSWILTRRSTALWPISSVLP